MRASCSSNARSTDSASLQEQSIAALEGPCRRHSCTLPSWPPTQWNTLHSPQQVMFAVPTTIFTKPGSMADAPKLGDIPTHLLPQASAGLPRSCAAARGCPDTASQTLSHRCPACRGGIHCTSAAEQARSAACAGQLGIPCKGSATPTHLAARKVHNERWLRDVRLECILVPAAHQKKVPKI